MNTINVYNLLTGGDDINIPENGVFELIINAKQVRVLDTMYPGIFDKKFVEKFDLFGVKSVKWVFSSDNGSLRLLKFEVK